MVGVSTLVDEVVIPIGREFVYGLVDSRHAVGGAIGCCWCTAVLGKSTTTVWIQFKVCWWLKAINVTHGSLAVLQQLAIGIGRLGVLLTVRRRYIMLACLVEL